MKNFWFVKLLRRVHGDEEGTISLETILILGAVALVVLIFLLKVGWPRIKGYFNQGMDDLDGTIPAAQQ